MVEREKLPAEAKIVEPADRRSAQTAAEKAAAVLRVSRKAASPSSRRGRPRRRSRAGEEDHRAEAPATQEGASGSTTRARLRPRAAARRRRSGTAARRARQEGGRAVMSSPSILVQPRRRGPHPRRRGPVHHPPGRRAERGRVAQVVLTGGRVAAAVYRAVAESPARSAIDWQRVEFWWGDERFLPRRRPRAERDPGPGRSARRRRRGSRAGTPDAGRHGSGRRGGRRRRMRPTPRGGCRCRRPRRRADVRRTDAGRRAGRACGVAVPGASRTAGSGSVGRRGARCAEATADADLAHLPGVVQGARGVVRGLRRRQGQGGPARPVRRRRAADPRRRPQGPEPHALAPRRGRRAEIPHTIRAPRT